MKGECRNSWRAEETVVSGETERGERQESAGRVRRAQTRDWRKRKNRDGFEGTTPSAPPQGVLTRTRDTASGDMDCA